MYKFLRDLSTACVISGSPCRTENPWEANMFYIPAMVYAYSENTGDTIQHSRRAIDFVRQQWPFFNRCARCICIRPGSHPVSLTLSHAIVPCCFYDQLQGFLRPHVECTGESHPVHGKMLYALVPLLLSAMGCLYLGLRA